jgi:membrane protease YdiL (CAAX protease family)
MTQTKNLFSDKTSAVLMILLLLMRFPLLILAQFGFIDNTISVVVFLTGTYLCTGVLLCRNLATLDQYCISLPALVLFLISPILAIISNPSDMTALVRMAMAVAFAIYLFRNKTLRNTVKNSIRAILWNDLFVLVSISVSTVLFAYLRGFSGTESAVSPSMLVTGFLFQLSFAAVMEEPLFRGFLWGSLRQAGIKEGWICVIQAALFWLAHIYYFNTGINFWVVVPIASLVLGLVILKTKSISYSMVTHAALNSLGDVFQHFVRMF